MEDQKVSIQNGVKDLTRVPLSDEQMAENGQVAAARAAAAKSLIPQDPLNSYVQSAAKMTVDDLKNANSRLYGANPTASIDYGNMSVPSSLRNKIATQLSGASASGLNQLNRSATDDYMKMQGMYQSLQDSKVRNEMSRAQQQAADYEAKKAKKSAVISGALGLAGTAAGAAVGGPAGAAIGGGAGSMAGGLL